MPLTHCINLLIGDCLKGNTTLVNSNLTAAEPFSPLHFSHVKKKKKHFQCLINILCLRQVLATILPLASLILLIYLLKSKQGYSQKIK